MEVIEGVIDLVCKLKRYGVFGTSRVPGLEGTPLPETDNFIAIFNPASGGVELAGIETVQGGADRGTAVVSGSMAKHFMRKVLRFSDGVSVPCRLAEGEGS